MKVRTMTSENKSKQKCNEYFFWHVRVLQLTVVFEENVFVSCSNFFLFCLCTFAHIMTTEYKSKE